MPEPDLAFRYVAFDPAGRRVKGAVKAASEARAFDMLRRDGLSPLKLSQERLSQAPYAPLRSKLNDAEIEALFSDMADLLRAGADIRAALAILGRRAEGSALPVACQDISAAISGGTSVETAVAGVVGARRDVLSALIAAGEAGGDLAAGFDRGARLLNSRGAIREQLITALSYPAFVLVSSLAAMVLILFFVIPSLAPLVEDSGGTPPFLLGVLFSASDLMRRFAPIMLGAFVFSGIGLGLLWRLGALETPIQSAALSGPFRRTAAGLVYGAFALSLGGMLTAGASMGDALRLAIKTVSWREARERLSPVLASVRQGETLSNALDHVPGFPLAIARLAAVGEATGSLGPMLSRSGDLEEKKALKRIEATAKLLGPMLIVALGGLIGLLMAALLSGLTGMGEAALH